MSVITSKKHFSISRLVCGVAVSSAIAVTLSSCRKADTLRITYSVQGVVEDISPDRHEVTIHHEAIPGYMNSMTMPFAVKNSHVLDGIVVHEPVLFELVITPKDATIDAMMGETKTTGIRAPDVPKPPDNARWLHTPQIGEMIPDIVLTNQEGRRERLRNELGKVLVLNFIYTQCPLPNYCPHSMAVFSAIQKKLNLKSRHDVMLVTMTFDPLHDTPERLATYGRAYGADPADWQLLTGRPEDIVRAVSYFDVHYWTDKGFIDEHTLSTVIVDPQGRIVKLYTGPDTRSEKIISDIQNLIHD